jgi:cell wall-associated NlpC family hydrolase
MIYRPRHLTLFGLALSSALLPGAALAQRSVDVQVGSWEVSGSDPTLYALGLRRPLSGPLGYGLRGLAVVDPGSRDGSLYGLAPELVLRWPVRRLVPYAVGGAGLSLRPTSSPEFVALWYAGLGVEWNPISWLGLGLEARYLAEDAGFRGFWGLEEDDRRGWVASARLAVRWGTRSGGSGGGTTRPPPYTSYDPGPPASGPAEPLGEASRALADSIVNTALSAMGEPYRWGGTSTDHGFDCSGLVFYAYGSYGVSVPRVSRDQARAGRPVTRDVALLEPGDILLFTNSGDAVTHVGLYVGNTRFIHATPSGGVRVGRLAGTADANDRWWRDRWVGARRVLR